MEKIELPTHISGDWWPGIGPITVKRNGIPLNLTGAEINMQVRRSRKTNEQIVAEWTTLDNSIEILVPSDGTFTIKGRVLRIPSGQYVSDVQVTINEQPMTIIPEIIWTIENDITR